MQLIRKVDRSSIYNLNEVYEILISKILVQVSTWSYYLEFLRIKKLND